MFLFFRGLFFFFYFVTTNHTALRFTRSYTKELIAIVKKVDHDSSSGGSSGNAQQSFNDDEKKHHVFSKVTTDVLGQVLCGVNAMNKYYGFVRAADSLTVGVNQDEERKTAEEFAMNLAQGFQRDLSRSLQLEQLKLTFDIVDTLEENDEMLWDGSADDDDGDIEEVEMRNEEAVAAWNTVVHAASASSSLVHKNKNEEKLVGKEGLEEGNEF